MINLREQPSYNFEHAPENNALRFNLHFMGVVSVDENKLPSDYNIWSQQDRIYISIPDKAGEDAQIELFDLLGNKLGDYNLSLSVPTVIQSSRASGIVVVRIIAGKNVYSSKLFIR